MSAPVIGLLRRRRGGVVVPVSSSPNSALPIKIGVNVVGGYYASGLPQMINLVQNGAGPFRIIGTDQGCPVDAQGWPTTDFGALIQSTNPIGDGVFKGFAGGYFDSATMDNYADTAFTNIVYDAGSNTTTFDMTTQRATSNAAINFHGTRKTGGAGGAINTGLTALKIAQHGYTIADMQTKVWTNEFVAYHQQFDKLRSMDLQQTNNRFYTWATTPQRATWHIGDTTIDDIVALANECNRDLHVCISTSYSDADVVSFVRFVRPQLNNGLNLTVEYSNEFWNTGFAQNGWLMSRAMEETNGLVGGNQTRTFKASRASNVVTLHAIGYTNYFDTSTVYQVAHGWTDGQTIYVNGFDGGPNYAPTGGHVVVHVVDAYTATFPSPGPDGEVNGASGPQGTYISANSSTWAVGNDASGTLNNFDHNTNPYALNQRWGMRRLCQISDVIRAQYPSRFNVDIFMIYADQITDVYSGEKVEYLKGAFPGTPPNHWFSHRLFAPYIKTYQTDNVTATTDDIANGLASAYLSAKTDFDFEQRRCYDLKNGLKTACYEGGPDVGMSPSTYSQELAKRRNDASAFSPQTQYPVETMLSDLQLVGVEFFQWYNSGTLAREDTGNGSGWGLTDSYANLDTPKLRAFADARAYIPTITRNVISPSGFDARQIAGNFANPPTGNAPSLSAGPEWLAFRADVGAQDLHITYSAKVLTAGTLSINGVSQAISFPSTGSHAVTAVLVVPGVVLPGRHFALDMGQTGGAADDCRIVRIASTA